MAPAPIHAVPARSAFAALCVLLVAIGVIATAGAAAPKQLGKTKHSPKPECPGDPCFAVGSVTGFQREADGRHGLFRAREDGEIVAFALDLSKPNQSQRSFFGKFFENARFGEEPTARIAVLQQRPRGRYRLKRQSPVVELGDLLGQKQYFTLGDPLFIKKGHILALTVPTWASNFAVEVSSRRNEWRASRQPGECNSNQDIKNGKPHQQVDTVRRYGCKYDTRLLYWGFYQPT
jgi:hypothetical protein